ncbi:sulfite exporter TauE/SafE family protein [Hymenobacter busanensis]|uniref:Sulfite exporter TauE/SafE family protein n=1 Tax=Hymenobacter busanensis TaxID=2607656 RepID=A0A7L4ZST6_9BACT|nr:sulfite exporter TauE/SafE family protein [Hymenobacter busanensis]KAA9327687.1 sulfite exporter TauE/SafE family protein [Hymenobacter busanensis]QHJ05973.1 sulfite exporter TauE/SafE family protein [Hymenobacter busanensis]
MLWAGFVFGLLGSFHCVGMCGAIALALPGAGPRGVRYVVGRVLYNLGRVSTYATLGAAAGLLGQSLRVAGLQQGLSVASGVLILLLVVVPERYTGRAAAAVGLEKVLVRLKQTLALFFQRPSLGALYTTGLLNGLLPCGLVYLALAGALSAGSVGGAAGYMGLFGLGTLPLMLVLSLTGQLVPLRWRTRLRQAVPVVAAVMAGLFIVRGLGLGIPYLSPALAQTLGPVGKAVNHAITMCHGTPGR